MKIFTLPLFPLVIFSVISSASLVLLAAPAAKPNSKKASPSATAPAKGMSRVGTTTASQTGAWVKARTTVGGFISNASNMDGDGASIRSNQTNQSVRGSAEASTSNVFGVGAQLIDMKTPNWGWFAGLTLEQSRDITSMTFKTGGQVLRAPFTNKPRFMPLIASGGAFYQFNSQFYALGGINYTVYKDFGAGDFRSASLDSKVGLQYGVGFRPFPRVSLELQMRDVRYAFEGSTADEKVTIDELRLTGMNIVGRYTLE